MAIIVFGPCSAIWHILHDNNFNQLLQVLLLLQVLAAVSRHDSLPAQHQMASNYDGQRAGM